MDESTLQGSLLWLSIITGGVAVDLITKGVYLAGIALIIITGVFIGVREYFKLS